MPSHPQCKWYTTCEQFEFLWRNFHCNHATSDDFEEDNQNELDDDEELLDLKMERVQRDQDPNVSEGNETLVDVKNEEDSEIK